MKGKPKKGQKYWSFAKKLRPFEAVWGGYEKDELRWKLNTVYNTKEEAEMHTREIRAFLAANNPCTEE